MQKKNYLEKSIQFTKWYKKILSEKTFGGKENLKLFTEWERFYATLALVKKKEIFRCWLEY